MAAWFGIPSLALQTRAGLWQQVGQRALVFLIVQEWQQVLLLQRELACQLSRSVSAAWVVVAPSSASNKMTA